MMQTLKIRDYETGVLIVSFDTWYSMPEVGHEIQFEENGPILDVKRILLKGRLLDEMNVFVKEKYVDDDIKQRLDDCCARAGNTILSHLVQDGCQPPSTILAHAKSVGPMILNKFVPFVEELAVELDVAKARVRELETTSILIGPDENEDK